MFTSVHRHKDKFDRTPFYGVSEEPFSFYEDPKIAQTSIDRMTGVDADPNILICLAHDSDLPSILNFFPEGTLNAWKEKGWKEKSRWTFLNELPVDGQPGRPWLVPGVIKEGHVLSEKEFQDL